MELRRRRNGKRDGRAHGSPKGEFGRGASLRELFGRGCGGEICVSERGFPFVEVSFFYTSAFDMFLLFGFPSPKEPIGCFLFWLSLFRASLRKNCFTIFLYSFLSSCGVNISSIIYGIGF